jgi:hypothetical protein
VSKYKDRMMNRKLLLGINSKILTNFSISLLAVLVLSLASGVYAVDYDFKNKLPGDNHGDNSPSEKNCKKSDTLEEISIKIDAEKCEIDDIKNYKEWDFYKLEDPETKQCLTFFEDLGGSLVDYEVVYCYAYPEKYDEKAN